MQDTPTSSPAHAPLRPELAALAVKIRALTEGLSHRDALHLRRAALYYTRSATVPTALALREGSRLGDLVLLERVEGSEHGRMFAVVCLRCESSWTMLGSHARYLFLVGKTICRTCRKYGPRTTAPFDDSPITPERIAEMRARISRRLENLR